MVPLISQSDVNAMERWRHASELPIDKDMLKMSRYLTRALVLQTTVTAATAAAAAAAYLANHSHRSICVFQRSSSLASIAKKTSTSTSWTFLTLRFTITTFISHAQHERTAHTRLLF